MDQQSHVEDDTAFVEALRGDLAVGKVPGISRLGSVMYLGALAIGAIAATAVPTNAIARGLLSDIADTVADIRNSHYAINSAQRAVDNLGQGGQRDRGQILGSIEQALRSVDQARQSVDRGSERAGKRFEDLIPDDPSP